MPIEKTILKALPLLRRDALRLRAAARHHESLAATPVMLGAMHRLGSVLEDFAHGIESATAARQCLR